MIWDLLFLTTRHALSVFWVFGVRCFKRTSAHRTFSNVQRVRHCSRPMALHFLLPRQFDYVWLIHVWLHPSQDRCILHPRWSIIVSLALRNYAPTWTATRLVDLSPLVEAAHLPSKALQFNWFADGAPRDLYRDLESVTTLRTLSTGQRKTTAADTFQARIILRSTCIGRSSSGKFKRSRKMKEAFGLIRYLNVPQAMKNRKHPPPPPRSLPIGFEAQTFDAIYPWIPSTWIKEQSKHIQI